jgi:AcrR family transcriptional regulator
MPPDGLHRATTDTMAEGARARILAAAARLFGERGLAGVGLREITTAAGTNLAAVNYHFGSKEKLLRDLFAQGARPITEERLRLLALCKPGRGRPPMLEQVLDAFLRPAFSHGAEFGRLRARLSVESEALYRHILSDAFDASTRAFLDAIIAALPGLPRAEVTWRFHFMLGTMVSSMANSGRIQAISGDAIDPADPDAVLTRLIPFLAAGFRVPLPKPPGPRETAPPCRVRPGCRRTRP